MGFSIQIVYIHLNDTFYLYKVNIFLFVETKTSVKISPSAVNELLF